MRKTKGEQSKERLLQSAEELFAQKGVAATTVSQIVANAGLTQAAFYLYFTSKDEILKEILDKFKILLFEYSDAGRQAGQLPAGKIEAFVTQIFIQLFELLGLNVNVTKIALQETEEGEQFRKQLVERIVVNMKMNQSLGVVNPNVVPEIVAESVIAAAERLVYRYSVAGEKSKEELGQQLANLFLRGILL
ncbi:TetR/AcrR family transcriptional regulator [Paenibacillus albiflavus]|uniref:TetR/AcrR family transcriptional regulator n=1 Tax=Paenibacillus albiflavus TaxID=2545760 RepID=A0A4R4EI83_9BACL|nr:TetR/AcrR family transcriptional regulator [Paenibacillus albiflavus]TCZ78920.1 TetR/AcrR family transcriptional regulator [Paenibacillus albiflavus]